MNGFEVEVLHKLHDALSCKFMDKAMTVISLLGDKGLFFIAFSLMLICIPKTRKMGISCGGALLMGLIIANIILKPLCGRVRPFVFDGEIELIIKRLEDFSFPSGHTLAAFEVAVPMMYYDKRFGIPFLVLAFLMMLSRMYLFMHYPTDVLAGALLGTALGLLSVFTVKKVYRKYGFDKTIKTEQ